MAAAIWATALTISACDESPVQPLVDNSCGDVVTFESGKTPSRIQHVSVGGNDVTGDGTMARPFRTMARAARDVSPGTAIYLHGGPHAGGMFLDGVRGTAEQPIWIMGAPDEPRPVIQGGGDGLHLVKPRYVVVQNLEIRQTAANGINVDDGDEVADSDAARFLVFRDLDIHDTGQQPAGIADCLKLAGVYDFFVFRSVFSHCGLNPISGAVGVGGVGVHRGLVASNRFTANGYGGAQFKGGSDDIRVTGNFFQETGWRAVNMGGRTGEQFFRPPLSPVAMNYEAARVSVQANIFVGSETAAAFTGCVDCDFSHNTVVDPSKWTIRILQESVTTARYAFAPASRGRIADNIFYFRRSDLDAGEDINVGPATDSHSFALLTNLWYAHDSPRQSQPRLKLFEGQHTGSIVGINPDFANRAAADFHLTRRSIAEGAGDRAWAPRRDFAGRCYLDSPSLGALQ